jgi:hypothetical protein
VMCDAEALKKSDQSPRDVMFEDGLRPQKPVRHGSKEIPRRVSPRKECVASVHGLSRSL